MSDIPPSIHEKTAILYRLGYLREQDRNNIERIESRWRIYQSGVTQKTIRSTKQKPPAEPVDKRRARA
jgi:hypothetical protein